MVIEGQGILIGGKLWGERAVVGEKKAFKSTGFNPGTSCNPLTQLVILEALITSKA